jgi:CPA2 family monovalent cation:H+ antiporter-2
VIAALGSELVDGPELGAVAAAYVLITAMVGPLAARFAESLPIPPMLARTAEPATTST